MIDKRIAYYTRKVAEFGAVHITNRRNQYRQERLLAYKKLLHQQIQAGKR